MEEMKCKSCGGILNVEDDKNFGECPFCKAKYKVNDNKTISFKMDDNTKESIKSGYKLFGKISLAIVIPVILVFILIISIAVYSFINIGKSSKSMQKNFFDIIEKQQQSFDDDKENTYDKYKKNIEDTLSEIEINSFNDQFEMYSGTEYGSSVGYLLDKVVTNNKKNQDKLITVIYGGVSTTEPSEIINIKSNFSISNKYEVIMDYGENKLINKITIENR